MRNFTKLLSKDFLKELNVSDADKLLIRNAVADVKKALQEGISKEWGISPRFMTQGSARYRTQNDPCHKGDQQVDHDIGCYLPLSSHKEEDSPKKAAREFFELVDTILCSLVKEKDWKEFSNDKDTCSRIIVNDLIHIDVPLYSVPDEEFDTIRESKTMETCAQKSFSALCSDSEPEETWDDFKFDKVLLAHRKDGWRPSDPRLLNDYFEKVFEKIKGEQLRRVCRYAKAFRDFKWKIKGPSSIYLMCVVDLILNIENEFGDDLALLDVLRGLKDLSTRHIKNPSEPEEMISISELDLENLKKYAESFYTDLERALKDTTLTDEEACELIRKHLGDRFPSDGSDIEHDRYRKITDRIKPSAREHLPPTRTRAG